MIAALSANTQRDGGPLCVFKGLLPQNGSHTWLEAGNSQSFWEG